MSRDFKGYVHTWTQSQDTKTTEVTKMNKTLTALAAYKYQTELH